MAISANKSPSPTPNSNSRNNFKNSENNSPMRRSFNGSPLQRGSKSFVPNSPTDFSSRNCFGKEEKENEKDYQTLKTAKARSPAVPKGVNHFMIPTISAASKINPSFRKKVLAERNEPLRSSLSFSDGRSSVDYTEDSDQKPFKGFNSKDSATEYSQKNIKTVLETPSNLDPSPKVHSHITPLKSPKFSESSDMFSSTKAFISSCSPNIALLDADPSVPPYDPKTNYLSPRPQFLRYKPNLRHKLYFQEEQCTGTNNLEEIFSSESFSDTDFSEGSDEPEVFQKQCEEDASSVVSKVVDIDVSGLEVTEESEVDSSKKELKSASPIESQQESEDAFLDENTSNETESVSEPEQIPTPSGVKSKVKSRFFTKEKFISLLLLFVMACVSVPLIELVRENLSTSKLYEESFNGLARNVKMWSDYSKVYINEITSSFSRADEMSPLQFHNMTYKILNPFIDVSFNGVARNVKMWSDYSKVYINEITSSFSRADEMSPLQFHNMTYKILNPFIDVKRFEEIYEQDVFEDEDEFESVLDQNMEEGNQNSEDYLEFESDPIQINISFQEKPHVEAPEFGLEESVSEVVKGDGAYNSEVVEDEFESLLDQNMEEEGDQNSEDYFEFESDTPQINIVFEEKPHVEALEFGLEELVSEVVKGDGAYNSEIVETLAAEGDDRFFVLDSELKSTAILSFGNTFEYNPEEQAASEVTVRDRAETVGFEGDDHLFYTEIESTPEASNFENISEVGTSQVGWGYIFETPENWEIKGDDLFISESEIVPTEIESNSENTLELDASTLELMPEYKSSEYYKALAMALVTLALIAAPVLSYLKNRNAKTPNTTVLVDPISTNETMETNPSMQCYSPEIIGESCASEMSSFDRSYSYSNKYTSGAATEDQSQERKQKRVLRRDLLASSSGVSISDSPSYGSFTTYEKIPRKHAYGEEEVATPVRRSSRIKKIQLTSP